MRLEPLSVILDKDFKVEKNFILLVETKTLIQKINLQ